MTALRRAAHVLRCQRLQNIKSPRRFRNHVLHHHRDLPPHDFADHPALFQIWIGRPHLPQQAADQRRLFQLLKTQNPRPQPIVNVMGVISDVVRNRRRLRLQRGKGRKLKRQKPVKFQYGRGNRPPSSRPLLRLSAARCA